MGKFVSQNNLSYFWQKIKTLLSGKADKSEIPTNTVKYSSQSLTDAQKTQARTNIGAGTSNFSGSYNDLSNKPTIPTNTNQLTNGAGFVTSSGSVATATNATKLNNQEPSYYLNYNNLSNKPSIPSTSNLLKLDGSNTMTGVLNLKATGNNETNIGDNGIRWGSTSLPEQTSPQYVCVIDGFAQGGRQKWSSVANLKTALGVPTNTNQLTNGAGFITSSSLGTQATFSLSGTTLTITPK